MNAQLPMNIGEAEVRLEDLVNAVVVVNTCRVGWEVKPLEAESQEWLVMQITRVDERPQSIRQRHYEQFGDQEFYAYAEGRMMSNDPARNGLAFRFCIVPSSVVCLIRKIG